eukprot:SAG11_NODE_8972_length_958_cov_0.720605_1_plen_126_part_00
MGVTVHADSKGRFTWEFFILVLVFYSSLLTPYNVAFDSSIYDENGPEESLKIKFRDFIVDLCFWLDILLTFLTAYDRGFELITDKVQIAVRYLKGWFIVDFMAVMPWGFVSDESVSFRPSRKPLP